MAPDITHNLREYPPNPALLSFVNSQIDLWRIRASALPFRHPARAPISLCIATLRWTRSEATGYWQKEDLDQAIVEYCEALFRGLSHPLLTIIAFCDLSSSLWHRFQKFGAREDLDHIISYHRHLYSIPLEDAGIKRFNILDNFACALRSRFNIEGRLEDIEESISLFRHIITLVPPSTDEYRIITYNLADAWKRKFKQTDESEHLTEAISHYRAALASCPLDHPSRRFYLRNLAEVLMSRFERSGDLNDVKDAATLRQERLDLVDKEDPDRMWVLMELANVYHSRFRQTDDSEDLEKAISQEREALLLCPPDHKSKDKFLGNLASSLTSRFANFYRMDCLEEAISLYRAALRLCPRGHPRRQEALGGLAKAMHLRCHRTHRKEDLEESINLKRETLVLTPPGHPMRPQVLFNLSLSLQTQYEWTGDMGYIEEGIEHLYEASKLVKYGRPLSRRIHHQLAMNLSDRFKHRGADKDIAYAIEHFRTSVSLIPEGHRDGSSILANLAKGLHFIFSRTGDAEHLEESIALIARSTRHSSALTAYRKALSLLQRAVDLGPTVQTRHEYINGQNIRSIPMNAASYAIESRAYKEAIEMLEQGRALLWSGMRSLRTPLDRLRGVDKSLADEFTEISQALEAIITTTDVRDFVQTPAGTDDDDSDVKIGRKDTFARDLAEKRRLSGELDKVVLRIRAFKLPELENFWRPIPFRHLQIAAMGGPVVIINLSKYRSDILIVRSNHPVVHIPTPTNFFHRATKLANQLSETRKSYLLESKKYDRVLRQTLEELSELLGIPEHSRIWLCPTSVLASLPIHAAGPISSHSNVKRYLCDIYVCSYTPSLSALIASRSNLSGSASGPPSLLIVGQPDESLPGVDSEARGIECLFSSGSVTRIAGEAATPENVIAHLPMHPWVHFACHGMLQPGRPFETSFLLQHNTHLTLLRIAKSHLPTAELAFLAACHTAELTDDGTPDEVLHLTAAMQFSGFRSVIGTMWAMVDEDGQDLSEYFYSKMFAAGAQVASYEKSARALRHATQKLRTKGISLERWVNFVHYGA
ncbi:TPR-like protein [Lactifluus subvellereus]|nr:TPR-like protein [Lactifluus subvellereus]